MLISCWQEGTEAFPPEDFGTMAPEQLRTFLIENGYVGEDSSVDGVLGFDDEEDLDDLLEAFASGRTATELVTMRIGFTTSFRA